MGLLWPFFLLLLLLIPAVVAAYVWMLRRPKRYAVQYSSLSLIRQAMPGGVRWRRHLPFALFLLALVSLVVTVARPVASYSVSSSRSTIVLALDVSLSMCASDIAPNRLTAAQEAAVSFIHAREQGAQVSIGGFGGFAELGVPPTADKDVLVEAVSNLAAARRTAIGSAILRSIDAISEINSEVPPVSTFAVQRDDDSGVERLVQPDIIVLLTDGPSNQGVRPLDAAQAAVDRGIRVYTIGYGTPQGSPFNCTTRQLRGVQVGGGFGPRAFGGGFGGAFGGGFGGGRGGFRRGLDEETLQRVAEMTEGEYYLAESSEELLDVFSNLQTRTEKTKVETEVSGLFAAAGALLALAGIALSLRWSPLP